MGTSKVHQILLISLFHLIQICSVFAHSKQSTNINSNNNNNNKTSSNVTVSPTIMFALTAKQITSGSIRRPASKLPFHHNISLTVSLLVGTPPTPVTMVLDTGSELSWLHCKKTPTQISIFDPLHSTSYSPIPCSSPTCKTRTRDFIIPVSCDPKKLCHVSVSYADASSMEGTLAMDNFQMAGSPIPGVFFGCMDQGFSSSSSDADSKTTGLLGMNRGSLSFVTQMGYPKFSYCISGQDASGVLLFGEANFSWLKARSYTPMVKISNPLPYFDRVAYSVQFEGIKVGGKILSLPKSLLQPDHTGAGQTMVDSGTQFSFLLGPVYTALRNEFLAQTKGKLNELGDPNYVFQGAMDLCYRVPLRQKGYPVLPTVTLMFQGAEMSVSVLYLTFYEFYSMAKSFFKIMTFLYPAQLNESRVNHYPQVLLPLTTSHDSNGDKMENSRERTSFLHGLIQLGLSAQRDETLGFILLNLPFCAVSNDSYQIFLNFFKLIKFISQFPVLAAYWVCFNLLFSGFSPSKFQAVFLTLTSLQVPLNLFIFVFFWFNDLLPAMFCFHHNRFNFDSALFIIYNISL